MILKANRALARNKSGINKLVEIKDECLDEIELVALDDPREPIMSVNDRILAIKNGMHNYRSHYVFCATFSGHFSKGLFIVNR